MSLENTMLSEISQMEKVKNHISLMWNIKLKVTNEQTRQKNKPKLIDTDNRMVGTRGKEGGGIEKDKGGGVKQMEIEEGLTLGGEHTMQYTEDVLQNCIFETYIILLTKVTLRNLIKIFK